MRCCFPLNFNAILAALFLVTFPSVAQSSPVKVLARQENGFNVAVIQSFVDKGDDLVAKGNLVEARKQYDKARVVSKQLLSFYRDLGGSFRGLDARVPREMDLKGRKTMQLLSITNLRLAALSRRQDQPELAVPVLVEVVRLMTPAKPEGQKAYQSLIELGFVDTPYFPNRKSS